MEYTMDKLMKNFLGEGSNVVENIVENIKKYTKPSLQESDEIDVAIKVYQDRIIELQSIREQGFETITEYTKYKQAQEIIEQYKSKNEIPPCKRRFD